MKLPKCRIDPTAKSNHLLRQFLSRDNSLISPHRKMNLYSLQSEQTQKQHNDNTPDKKQNVQGKYGRQRYNHIYIHLYNISTYPMRRENLMWKWWNKAFYKNGEKPTTSLSP